MDVKEKRKRNAIAVKKYREKNKKKYLETTKTASLLYRLKNPQKTREAVKKCWDRKDYNKGRNRNKANRVLEAIRDGHLPKTNNGIKEQISLLRKEIIKLQTN